MAGATAFFKSYNTSYFFGDIAKMMIKVGGE
jgi:hypothetical protein